MKIDKDELKNNLTIEQVYDFVGELGGEPQMMHGFFIARTLCHNPVGEGSHKLYYYEGSHLFHCYTNCQDSFDIFALVQKIEAQKGKEISLPKAMNIVASYFGYSAAETDFENNRENNPDWEIFNIYDKISSVDNNKIVEVKTYDPIILDRLPKLPIEDWEVEGITREIMDRANIHYNPISHGIVIPHYDINNNLIGIRERTLVPENEQYGKYRPAFINGILYNHPLSFNLYNINNSKDNIKKLKKAFIFEGEKSTLLYSSFFGAENDISVAVCGSQLVSYQVQLLLSLGVEEIIIAFDKQWQQVNDDEFKSWTKKLTDIHTKYSPFVNISFLFDKENLLGYKDAPVDKGKEVFLKLFERRIRL